MKIFRLFRLFRMIRNLFSTSLQFTTLKCEATENGRQEYILTNYGVTGEISLAGIFQNQAFSSDHPDLFFRSRDSVEMSSSAAFLRDPGFPPVT